MDTHTDNISVIELPDLYKKWFIDYASYVVLERAVPSIEDGLKPVQRRILHSMKELEDGRYNKIANVIGNTMKYHPHGDASIGDAIIQIGQKNLLIDMQGNWGNTLTGDHAAAPRYIEGRLEAFAREILFNEKTTDWTTSYDGRNKEPIHIPCKFPLLLCMGTEGIAVGLACKILSHNFVELIEASIHILQGKTPKIYPDFDTGGYIDVTDYQDGLKGGKLKSRCVISKEDKNTLSITQLPALTTTNQLIDSILKAHNKQKIKIKKIEDNTASTVEIIIHLPNDISPDKTINALYAYTDCEVSISPNSCIIKDKKPSFLGVSEILRENTFHTKALLLKELNIKLNELQHKHHTLSLEKIFIEQKIYIEFDQKTYEEAIEITKIRLQPHIINFTEKVTEEHIKQLLEIKMRRITKHDSDQVNIQLQQLQEDIQDTQRHITHITKYTIEYYKNLKKKYGKDKGRKSVIKTFEQIDDVKHVIKNKKLYINRKEGFIGWGIKNEEFLCECSEVDMLLVIFKNGVAKITPVADKKFLGKNILLAKIWHKADKRTIYQMIYTNTKTSISYIKRFNITSLIKDKDYLLTKTEHTKVLYASCQPNGEGEILHLFLKGNTRKNKHIIDTSHTIVKQKIGIGNQITKQPIQKVVLNAVKESTLDPIHISFDETINRLNTEKHGKYIGAFSGNDKILCIYESGYYTITNFDIEQRFNDDLYHIEKLLKDSPISVIYYNGIKKQYYVKRFVLPEKKDKYAFMSATDDTLFLATSVPNPIVEVTYTSSKKQNNIINIIDVFPRTKDISALGNIFSKDKINYVTLVKENKTEDIPAGGENTQEDNTQNTLF